MNCGWHLPDWMRTKTSAGDFDTQARNLSKWIDTIDIGLSDEVPVRRRDHEPRRNPLGARR